MRKGKFMDELDQIMGHLGLKLTEIVNIMGVYLTPQSCYCHSQLSPTIFYTPDY